MVLATGAAAEAERETEAARRADTGAAVEVAVAAPLVTARVLGAVAGAAVPVGEVNGAAVARVVVAA